MVFEIFQHAANVVVKAFHYLGVVAHVALVFPAGEGVPLKILRVEVLDNRAVEGIESGALIRVHSVDVAVVAVLQTTVFVRAIHFQVVNQIHVAAYAHFCGFGCGTSFVIVVEVGRIFKRAVLVKLEIAGVRKPVAVYCLVVNHEAERFFGVSFVLKPVKAPVGDYVGEVTVMLHGVAVHFYEIRVPVVALSGKHRPFVEALRQTLKMPFTEDGGLVALFLKIFRESGLVAVEYAVFVVGEAVFVAVLSGEHTCAARARNGVCHIAAGEFHAVVGYTVKVGSRDVAGVIRAHHLCRMVISHDIHDVKGLLV